MCFCSEVCADDIYVFDMKDIKGEWSYAKVEERNTVCTDKKNNIAKIFVVIPENGKYQLMVSIYHRWRKYCPFLYFEVVDSMGQTLSGYTFSETRLYMKPGKGRWEYRSPSAEPFWYLNKGKAEIRFWMDAKNNCWERKDVPMEAKVFIEKLVFIPIQDSTLEHQNIVDENNIEGWEKENSR